MFSKFPKRVLAVVVGLPILAGLLIVVAAEVGLLYQHERQGRSEVDQTATTQRAEIERLTARIAKDRQTLGEGEQTLLTVTGEAGKAKERAAIYDTCTESLWILLTLDASVSDAEVDAAFDRVEADCPGLDIPAGFNR